MHITSSHGSRKAFAGVVLAGVVMMMAGIACPAAQTGPWNLNQLQKVPEATWGETNGPVQQVYYVNEPLSGKPTKVFAYYGRPEGAGPFPGMVLVHGGGGTAFPNWVRYWVARGYAAIAMDLSGSGPGGRLPEGGPRMADDVIFRNFTDDQVRDMWSYHAVAAVIRAHSLLLSRPEVDRKRTGITGISWGGHLTCIVAGLDRRFKAAAPVYGCGFINENSAWVDSFFNKMETSQRERWARNFDPSRYLGQTRCPMLFVNGTCDFAYPLDSYRKSYSLVRAPVTLDVLINRPHGHIWTFKEVDAFIDSILAGGAPLPRLGAIKVKDATASATLRSKVPVRKAELDYTTDSGPWQKRIWRIAPAEIKGSAVSAVLPAERPLVFYFRVTDERGLSVSTSHAELGPGRE